MFMLSTEKQISEVVRLRDDEELTFKVIGDRLGFSESTAKRRYRAGILQQEADALSQEELDEFPKVEPKTVVVNSDYIPDNQRTIERLQPMTRVGDAVVSADWHVPLHDPAMANTLINCAKQKGIDKLIIAGDFFNMDQFSSYLPHQPEASFAIERYEGNLIMKTLLRHFTEIDFVWGNHDFRLTKALGYKHSFTDCMKWVLSDLDEEEMSKIRFSDLDYMEYYPSETKMYQKYRICHPRNFSSIPLAVPRKLAIKYSSSIITAHSHHCAIGAAQNGEDVVIELGGLFNKRRTEYIQQTSAHHEWTPGFVVFKEGVPGLISPVFGNDVYYRKEVSK